MILYIFFYILFIPFVILDYVKLSNREKNITLFFLGGILSLFVGSRLIGPDLQTYKILYNLAPNLYNLSREFNYYTFLSKFEPLFIFLYSLSKTLNLSFETFNLVYSTIFVFLFIITIPKYTRYSFLAIFIYIGFAYMSGWSALRQFMGASIFFYSLQFLFNGNRWKYLICIVLATLLHYSAIVLIPLVLIPRNRFKTIWYYVLMIVFLMLYFSGIISVFLGQILSYFPFLDKDKVENAIESEDSLISSVFILWTVINIICLIAYKSIKEKVAHFDYFFNILFSCYLTYILLVGMGGLGRVIMYYKIMFPVFIPILAVIFVKKQRLLFVMGILIISMYIYTNTIIGMDQNAGGILDKFIPYKSWLFN